MLEELKRQREEYAAEVEALRNTNIEDIINAKFEEVKEQIAQEVITERNDKIATAERNVEHYDFVIATMEAKESEINEAVNAEVEECEVEAVVTENTESNNEELC